MLYFLISNRFPKHECVFDDEFAVVAILFFTPSSIQEIAVHGGTSTGSTKINLEFNIRRANGNSGGTRQSAPTDSDFNYNLDGQAFVPPALTNEGNNGANNSNERCHVQITHKKCR